MTLKQDLEIATLQAAAARLPNDPTVDPLREELP